MRILGKLGSQDLWIHFVQRTGRLGRNGWLCLLYLLLLPACEYSRLQSLVAKRLADPSSHRTCTSSMAASTYAGMERDLGVSPEVAILSISLFVLGLGVGPLLLGPLSEFLGRNRVSSFAV